MAARGAARSRPRLSQRRAGLPSFLTGRERLPQGRDAAVGVEELIGGEAAQAPLDVAARLVERDLLDELVELERAVPLEPAGHRAGARVVRSQRQRGVLEA